MSRSPGGVAALVVACSAAALTAADIGLVLYNQWTAGTVAARRDFIAQTPQLVRVMQVVAASLAQAAARNDDPTLRTLLSANGITVGGNAPVSATSTPVASTQPTPRRTP